MFRTIYLTVFLALLLSFTPYIESAHAVPKSVKAKSEFMLADKLFNEKNYSGAIEHAEKAKSLLGKSNSRIEYVLTKAYNAQGKYDKALAALEAFFNVTPESRASSTEYNEMVALYAQVEQLAKNIKQQEKIVFATVDDNMIRIPGGCFQMGKYSEDDDAPTHEVCLDSFSINRYEVTQKLWIAIMSSNPSLNNNDPNYPVEQVTWNEVQKFLKILNLKTNGKYRLPTEAEWEYAARSGGKQEKYAGFSSDSVMSSYANFCDYNCTYTDRDQTQDDGFSNSAPVGSFKPNGLGLHDMIGNVWEWCSDWNDDRYYHLSPRKNPIGPSGGTDRIVRGGSWCFGKRNSSSRGCAPTDVRFSAGFRLAHP